MEGDVTMTFIRMLEKQPLLWQDGPRPTPNETMEALLPLQARLTQRGLALPLTVVAAKVSQLRRLFLDHAKFRIITGHRSLHVAENYFNNLQFLYSEKDIEAHKLSFGYNHQKTLEDMHNLFDPVKDKYANDTLSVNLDQSSNGGKLMKTIVEVNAASQNMLTHNLQPERYTAPSVVILNPNTSKLVDVFSELNPSTDQVKTAEKKDDVIDLDSDDSNDFWNENPIDNLTASNKHTDDDEHPNRNKLLDLVSDIISDEQTNYGPYSLYVVRKLREMPNDMAILCRKLITDTIREAESGKLNSSSTIENVL